MLHRPLDPVEFVAIIFVNLLVASASRQLSLMSMVLVSFFVVYPTGQSDIQYFLWFPVVISKFLAGFISPKK